jgi:hypothetical protein
LVLPIEVLEGHWFDPFVMLLRLQLHILGGDFQGLLVCGAFGIECEDHLTLIAVFVGKTLAVLGVLEIIDLGAV